MRRLLLFVSLLMIAVQPHVFAQAKPDPSPAPKPNFSGTWILAPVVNDPGGRGGRGGFNLGLEFNVAQDDKTITLNANPNRGAPAQSIYKLDGSANAGVNGSLASKIAWEGSKLVITLGSNPPRTQTWSLDATGSLLTVVSETFMANNTITSTSVYQKK